MDLERGFGVGILDRRGRPREKPRVGIDRGDPSVKEGKEKEKNHPQKMVSAVVVKNAHGLKKYPSRGKISRETKNHAGLDKK
jgi:hypothetical protein